MKIHNKAGDQIGAILQSTANALRIRFDKNLEMKKKTMT